MTDYDFCNSMLTPCVREAIVSNQTYKIAQAMTGIEEFTFNNIADYIGTKVAQRHAKWRPVANGLLALNSLLPGA
jgi:CO dehydrogenase/acetyl-CoA synthase alpha subunit